MNKKDFLKTLDIASFVAIVIATILVFIFQFNGEYLVVKFAIITYSSSFALMATYYGLTLAYNLKKTTQNNELVVEDMNKKQRAFLITKTVLSAIAFVFTLVIVILY